MPSAYLALKRPGGLSNSQWDVLAGKAYVQVRAHTPVDTGRLKSSWREVHRSTRSVKLKTDDAIAPYAAYVDGPRTSSKTGKVIPPSAQQAANQNFTGRAHTSLMVLAGKMLNR